MTNKGNIWAKAGALVLLSWMTMGCNNLEKILPKNEGAWRTTQIDVREYSRTSGLDTSYVETPTNEQYFFRKDGSGFVTNSIDTLVFAWVVRDGGAILNLCFDANGGLQVCFDNEVLTSEKDVQLWSNSNFDQGDSTWTEQDIHLERQ